jgi:hypothetical protein
VEALVPQAIYHQVPSGFGYAQACNEGAALVTEGSHLLFLHDDAALAPEAVSAMMEVAFSKNAGIVTPKVVLWDSPSQIVQLGWDLDRTGAPASRVDVGDLDQAQYDDVEEVMVAPGGALLIRKDLFEALDGFDPSMLLFGEDVDLSWRTRLVGARIYTAPLARVRHKMISTLSPVRQRQQRRRISEPNRERSGVERSRRLRYSRRHQLKTLLKNQSGFSRIRSVATFLTLTTLEALYYLLTGRVGTATAILGALGWNIRHQRELRREASKVRTSKAEGVESPKFLSGSSKLSAFLATRRSLRRLQESVGEVVATSSAGKISAPVSPVSGFESFLSKISKGLLWLVALLLLVALWSVLFGRTPLVGTFAHFPSLVTLFHSYFAGNGGSSLTGASAAPPIDLIFGLLGLVTFGYMGALQHLLLLAAIVGGATAVFRLTRRRATPTGARLATVVFLLFPLLSDLFGRGNYLMILAGVGLLPWLIVNFHRSLDAQRSSRRSKRRAYLGTGLLGAVTLAASPSIFVVFLMYGLAYAVMAFLRRSNDSSRRAALALGVVAVSGLVVDLPWSLSLVNPSVGMARVFGASPPQGLSMWKLVELSVNASSHGSISVLGFLLFVLVAMSFVRDGRAVVLGSLLVGYTFFLLFAALDTSGLFGGSPLPILAIMSLMAILLAQAVGISVDALTEDLPRHRLSFRHALGGVGVLALVVSTLGSLQPLTTSRLGMPSAGFARSLSFIGVLPHESSVLWIGDQNVLPVGGWKLTNGLSVALVSQEVPDVRSLYAPASYGSAAPLVRALRSAIAGNDVQLGSTLAHYGVRYVVVPQPSTSPGFFVGTDLDLIFERQVDLKQLLVDPAVAAFEVTEPVHGYVGSTTLSSTILRVLGLMGEMISLALVASAFLRRRAWLIRVDLPQVRVRRGAGSRVDDPPLAVGAVQEDRSEEEEGALGEASDRASGVAQPDRERSINESDEASEPQGEVDVAATERSGHLGDTSLGVALGDGVDDE